MKLWTSSLILRIVFFNFPSVDNHGNCCSDLSRDDSSALCIPQLDTCVVLAANLRRLWHFLLADGIIWLSLCETLWCPFMHKCCHFIHIRPQVMPFSLCFVLRPWLVLHFLEEFSCIRLIYNLTYTVFLVDISSYFLFLIVSLRSFNFSHDIILLKIWLISDWSMMCVHTQPLNGSLMSIHLLNFFYFFVF